jgi:hypothetical protein
MKNKIMKKYQLKKLTKIKKKYNTKNENQF